MFPFEDRNQSPHHRQQWRIWKRTSSLHKNKYSALWGEPDMHWGGISYKKQGSVWWKINVLNWMAGRIDWQKQMRAHSRKYLPYNILRTSIAHEKTARPVTVHHVISFANWMKMKLLQPTAATNKGITRGELARSNMSLSLLHFSNPFIANITLSCCLFK